MTFVTLKFDSTAVNELKRIQLSRFFVSPYINAKFLAPLATKTSIPSEKKGDA